jgi:hypothetical protein
MAKRYQWLLLWYLLAIVLSVHWVTSSDYYFGIFWPLCCLSIELRLLITTLISFGHCVVCPLSYDFWLLLWYLLAIVLSVHWVIASDYYFGIFWPLCCLSIELWLLITTLISFGHCVVCRPKDTKVVIRSHNSLDRQHNGQKIPK